ncbi:MAG: response regulator [Opitutales bacterium]
MSAANIQDPSSALTVPTRRCRVLLLDDEPKAGEIIRHWFQQVEDTAYGIVEVNRVEDALKLCGVTRFDILLVDYRLDGETGLDFLDGLNSRFPDHPWPVIMMTGQGDADTAAESLRRGACDFLAKPSINASTLAQAFNRVRVRIQRDERLARRVSDLEKQLVEQQRRNERLERELEDKTVQLMETNRRLLDEIQRSLGRPDPSE